MMGHLVKFRFVLLVSILRISVHLGSARFNTQQVQSVKNVEHRWSPQRPNFAIIPVSHQFSQDAKPSLSCLSGEFVCADGLTCIHESARCDGYHDCGDRSDETESLCAPPCSIDMFACADGTKCVSLSTICDGNDNCSDGSDEAASLCTPPCSAEMFACEDGLQCISKSIACDGFAGSYKGCNDKSHNFPSQCDNCSADHLFRCQMVSSVDVCLHDSYKCDGNHQCIDFVDELESECPHCADDPSQFTCSAGGQMVCWMKWNQCDGSYQNCDDGSDEDPATCGNCTNQADFAICRDGNTCFNHYWSCDGRINCSDGSDESDTYSQCNYCTEEESVSCPGFPGNCGKLCDGQITCPDRWDELLSTCKSRLDEADATICSEEAGQYQCKDGSLCLDNSYVCDGFKECSDGSDEDSVACQDECQHVRYPLHHCDNGSCIWQQTACSAREKPLCEDGSDMAYDLCQGKCYNVFPFIEDPYMWPCANGTKKCILHTSLCDGYPDCDDGTELSYSSDERNCPLITRIGLFDTLLLCLAILAVSWILFFALTACLLEHNQNYQDSSFDNSDPSSAPPDQAAPSFLLHPALSDMDNQSWNWQEVGEQLRLEVVFFNKDPQVLFDFLYQVESENAHPDNLYTAFTGFYNYMTSMGFNQTKVAMSIRQTIGHHRLAHMALRGPPNLMDKKVYEIGRWLMELETKGKVYQFLLSFLRAIQTSIPSFLVNLDFLKDFILYLILRETVRRVEENCVQLGFDCLSASGTEKDILTVLLITFCVSVTLTSIDSFFLRKRFFRTNYWLDLIFVVLSPILPAIYQFRLSQMNLNLAKQKSKPKKFMLREKASCIEKLSNSLQSTKEIEVGFEAITQIFLLLGLACFDRYLFKAPSGQTYSYFFGVAHLVMKGNFTLFLASILISFLGPCWFYVNRTNVLRHESLNMSRKLVLMIRNVLFLLVRVFAIVSAIFIPVIKSCDVFIKNKGIDASSVLGDWRFHLEFQKHFSKGLEKVSADIRMNALFFGLFIFVHLILVASYGVFSSAKFGKGSMKEKAIYLISTFSLPLPFLTIKEVDRGEEKAELWFLVVLHSLENSLIVFASRLLYTQSSYPLAIIVFDCVLVLMNTLAVIVSIFYVTKLELFAGLPRDLPTSLPSYCFDVSFDILNLLN